MALENKKKDESSDFLLDFTKKVNHLYDLLKEVKKRPPPPSNSTDTVTDSTPSSHASVAKQKPASLLQKVWKLITVPCQRCLKKKKLAELQKETAKDSSSVQKEVLQTSTSNTENTKITESNIKDKGTENKTKKEQDAEHNKKDEEKGKVKENKKEDTKDKKEQTKKQGKGKGQKPETQEQKEEKQIVYETKTETKEDARKLEDKYFESLKNYRFRYIKDFDHHHYVNDIKSQVNTPKFLRRLQSEYIDLSKSLPIHADASVFVRARESNISLCQMMIMPANGPYQRGAFLFDIHFPSDYPNIPPHVNLQTTGKSTFRFNPNLYACGKVCLSLLGTWHGRAGEGWQAGISTILQVAVSIMSQIFVEEPFYNEPGYEYQMHTPEGKKQSDSYNSPVRNATLKFAMIEQIEHPPKGFEYVTLNHFYLNKDRIIRQVQGWREEALQSTNKSTNATVSKELPGLVDKLTKLLTELKEPTPSKDDDEEDDDDDDD